MTTISLYWTQNKNISNTIKISYLENSDSNQNEIKIFNEDLNNMQSHFEEK